MKEIKEVKIKSYLTFKVGTEMFDANVSNATNNLVITKYTAKPKAPA